MNGGSDTACGFGGQACQNCAAMQDTCQFQQCMPLCNPNNCAGCCDSTGMCQPGFLDNLCGGFGGVCQDCTKLMPPSTCNGNLSPPACASQQMQCPSPYGGCQNGLSTMPIPPQMVCSQAELSNGAVACKDGAYTTACFNFFNFEFNQNPACGSCLQPFDFAFSDEQGLYNCIAPYVTAACNHSTACETDCTSQSCAMCPDQTTYNQCIAAVDSGQCSMFFQSGNQCEMQAYAGMGSFCNPNTYANFGAWFASVGKVYCGM
jgi:hypothetical protein